MSKNQVIHLDCITAPNDGLNPSVILTACRAQGAPLTAQYVFNVPDAVSRFCLEHKLRPGLGLRGVFVTGTGHELHGLPGLVMRLRGDGQGAFELFGPGETRRACVPESIGQVRRIDETGVGDEVGRDGQGMGGSRAAGGPIERYVRAMPNVCSWKTPSVLVSEFQGGASSSSSLYEDEHVRVWALWDNRGDGADGTGGTDGTDGADGDPGEAFTAPSRFGRADILEQVRSLAPAHGADQHSVFGRQYRKCRDVMYGDMWVRMRSETMSAAKGDGGYSKLLGYACYVKGADHVVVVSGYAHDVATRFEDLRRHRLVRHCMDRRGDGTNDGGTVCRVPVTIIVAGVRYNAPKAISNEPSIRLITLPVVGKEASPGTGLLGFDSTAKTAARLHTIFPHIFPAPYAWKYLRDETVAVGPGGQPPSGSFRVTFGPATPAEDGAEVVKGNKGVEGASVPDTSAVYTAYTSESRISSTTELHARCRKAAEFLDALEEEEKLELTSLREKIQGHTASRRMLGSVDTNGNSHVPANNQSAAALLRLRLVGGAQPVNKRKRDQEETNTEEPPLPNPTQSPTTTTTTITSSSTATTASDLTAPYVLFLGTGSAEPSKYRGPSGILVKIPYMDDDYLLMECGEGTFGQLVRMFGHAGAMDRLAKLRCVWISHRHADHISGLVELLSRRAHCDAPKESELLVLGPKACLRWLRSLQPIVNMGRLCIEHFANAHHSAFCRHVQQRIHTKMTFTPVHHCHDAFAVSFVFGLPGGGHSHHPQTPPHTFKLVYSGDTEPCEALVRDGHGADLIIHEATFEPEMVRDARSKKHSTIQEALHVARRAGAARVILTHFSQRYPKFPRLDDHEIHVPGTGVGVAFDGFVAPLETSAEDLSKLTAWVKDFFETETHGA